MALMSSTEMCGTVATYMMVPRCTELRGALQCCAEHHRVASKLAAQSCGSRGVADTRRALPQTSAELHILVQDNTRLATCRRAPPRSTTTHQVAALCPSVAHHVPPRVANARHLPPRCPTRRSMPLHTFVAPSTPQCSWCAGHSSCAMC